MASCQTNFSVLYEFSFLSKETQDFNVFTVLCNSEEISRKSRSDFTRIFFNLKPISEQVGMNQKSIRKPFLFYKRQKVPFIKTMVSHLAVKRNPPNLQGCCLKEGLFFAGIHVLGIIDCKERFAQSWAARYRVKYAEGFYYSRLWCECIHKKFNFCYYFYQLSYADYILSGLNILPHIGRT